MRIANWMRTRMRNDEDEPEDGLDGRLVKLQVQLQRALKSHAQTRPTAIKSHSAAAHSPHRALVLG